MTEKWILAYDGSIHSESGKFICGFRWDSYKEFTEGDNAKIARRIVAAPALYEALKGAMAYMDTFDDSFMSKEDFAAKMAARAALAAATPEKGQDDD